MNPFAIFDWITPAVKIAQETADLPENVRRVARGKPLKAHHFFVKEKDWPRAQAALRSAGINSRGVTVGGLFGRRQVSVDSKHAGRAADVLRAQGIDLKE